MTGAHNRFNTLPLPLWVTDFLLGTAEESEAEVGCYIRLLCYQWINGSVPADPRAAAKATGNRKKTAEKVLKNHFRTVGDRAINSRLEKDRTREEERGRKYKKRAQLAAEARWSKESSEQSLEDATSIASSTPQASAKQCRPSPSLKDTDTPSLRSGGEEPPEVEASSPPLTPQQQYVEDAWTIFDEVDAPRPTAGLLGKWAKELNGNRGYVLDVLRELAPAGYLAKGHAYVYGAIQERKNGHRSTRRSGPRLGVNTVTAENSAAARAKAIRSGDG